MEWNCFWAEYKDFWPLPCQTLPHRNTPTGNGGYMVRQTWNGKCEFLLHPDTGHPPFYRVPPQTRPDGRPSAASIKTELKAAYPHAFSEEEMERFFHECDSIIPCKGGRMAYASELRGITCPVFLRLLYSSGIRTTEARLLMRRSVDFGHGMDLWEHLTLQI